jgi:type IX secretion system PorP/SprF family membrane protein
MKKLFCATILYCLLMNNYLFAQQDPIYAQYITNPLTINPAFVGIHNQFSTRIQYRHQWAGLEANPRTLNFSSNVSIAQNKVGLGLVVLHDQLGDIRNLEVAVPVSYKIKLETLTISFGMQAGFVNQKNNPARLSIFDPDDQAFSQYSEMAFNLGSGILVKGEKFRVGLSVPRLLPATINTQGQEIELYKQHFYLMGAYNFMLKDKLWLKPSLLLRGTKGSPLSADINATFTYRDYYSAGLFTRNFQTYGALIQVVLKDYHLTYVFELPQSRNAGLRFTSHEIGIGISKGLFTYHDLVPKTF